MPVAPYSDNLYSDPDPAASHDDDSAAAASALSPSDGYFHSSVDDDGGAVSPTSQHPSPHPHPHPHPHHQQSNVHRSSASVPYVPNVLVEDPTLSKDPDSKAHIAQRLINSGPGPSSSSAQDPTHHFNHNTTQSSYYPSASPSVSGASVATPSTITTASPQPPRLSYAAQPGRRPQDVPGQQRQLHVGTSSPHHQPSLYTSTYNAQGDAPPPAYTPSSPDNNPTTNSYATFPSSTSLTMGVPEEQQHLLSSQQQQPFGDSPKHPLWQRIKHSHDSGSLRKKVKRILGILVFVSIVLVFLGVNMSGPDYRKHIIDKSPIRIPDMDESELVWHPGRGCRDTPRNLRKESFHPSLGSDRILFIEQTIRKRDWTSPSGPTPRVDGEVILRPADGDTATIDVEIIANHKDLDIEVNFDTGGNTDHLKVTTPHSYPDSSTRDACIQIRITAWIPEKSLVDALAVNTVSLNVFTQDGFSLGAENSVDFSTVSGNIVFPTDASDVEPYKIESPGYKYETVSGDIKGWFPKYHHLKMTTVSGDVTAQIKHKDILLKSTLSALLHVSSVSGAVKIDDGSEKADGSGEDVPARDYLVKLSTTSGNIVANIFAGSSSEFVTVSGELKLDLLPVFDERWLDNSWRPLLKTDSISGGHSVTVKEPLFKSIPDQLNPGRRPSLPKTDEDKKRKEGDAAAAAVADGNVEQEETKEIKRRRFSKGSHGLTALESRHSSISGNMHLNYPASWEGSFTASSMSSDITFRGKDVVLDKKKGGFVGKEVSGHKGDGSSSLKIDQLSGNVVTWIGTE